MARRAWLRAKSGKLAHAVNLERHGYTYCGKRIDLTGAVKAGPEVKNCRECVRRAAGRIMAGRPVPDPERRIPASDLSCSMFDEIRLDESPK